MALQKPYLDVPGTTVFDAEQSRKGYPLNQFCMSLMKADNRARFKINERAYLDEWPMTEEQKLAVLARDLNRCIAAGGNPQAAFALFPPLSYRSPTDRYTNRCRLRWRPSRV